MAVACAMGLTVGAGMASRVMAQDGQIRTVAELNRAIAPENLDPSMQTRTKRFDKDGDGYMETVGRLYFTKNGGRIAGYSHNSITYYIAVDSDRHSPFDYTRLSSSCDGRFDKEVSGDIDHAPPKCSYLK